jgi:tetratricopeptide (TPR) repeat protein
VIEEWFGPWDWQKAAFAIELARVANGVSPAKTWPLLSAGLKYLIKRPMAGSEQEDAFEQSWHQIALALLQQHMFADYEEFYVTALQAHGAQRSSILPPRFALARGIAQEQRCWLGRISLDRAGDAADEVTRAAGQHVTSGEGLAKSLRQKQQREEQNCWGEATLRFVASFDSPEGGAEAHVRAAWTLYQLGKYADALRAMDGAVTGSDRDVAYWAGLFRGRISDALGRPADAERGYRAALAANPDAQSAGIGLALTLFKMDRDTEADAMAVQLRTRKSAAGDPWWTYWSGDQRFIDRWINEIREPRR